MSDKTAERLGKQILDLASGTLDKGDEQWISILIGDALTAARQEGAAGVVQMLLPHERAAYTRRIQMRDNLSAIRALGKP